MSWVDIIGFAAFLFNVAGNLMLAWQTVWGWVVRLVSIVLWFAYAWDTSSPPLIANAITFFCINLFGLWKWRRDAQKKRAICGHVGEKERRGPRDEDRDGPVITKPGPEKLLIKCLVCKSEITYRVSDINDDYITCPGCGHEVLA